MTAVDTEEAICEGNGLKGQEVRWAVKYRDFFSYKVEYREAARRKRRELWDVILNRESIELCH